MIVAGIGCRTGVSAEAVLAILEEAIGLLPAAVMPGLDPGTYPLRHPDAVTAPQGVGPRIECAGDEERPEVDEERPAGDEMMGQPFSLAVPEFRRNEPGIATAAASLGVPVLWVERAALRGEQGRCLTRSARAEAEVGLSCVAEAAALSAAGPGSRLLLPRIAGGGVTCALAEGTGSREPGS